MNGEVTLRDLNFSDVDDEDIVNDPDYEPQPSEPGATDSDVSMTSSALHNTTSSSSTDISIPSAIPSDAQSIGDVSEIYPDDSISQRNAKLAAQARRFQSAIDMALQFPHAEVIGLDLVPPANVAETTVPPNCRFEVDDANLSFEHYKDCFNVVHVRSADQGVNDFESFLYEIARTLRPNGLLLLATGVPQIYDIDAKPFPVVEEGEPNWLQHTLAATYTAFGNRNNTAVDCSLYWQRWLERNPNYKSPLTRDTFVPLGPFRPNMSEREVFISNLMREDIARVMHAFRPLLVGDGVPEPEVDRWIANSVKELRELRICGHIKWRYTVAIRNTRPWQERMEQPEPLDLPRERLIVEKAERGSVVSGCSTNITAKTSSSGGATVQPATVTSWALGVPAGPPRSK
ncbi:hypothetical protein M407DRAFT_17199 [Tulasnella calospora MUT 4182]|uniref:Methyltransferase type 11 domain-containing protein n=1 Tax=Tulasnella calospora MUT 4182 TaxID=1051891 RepID=A0A0C3MJQ0_9AGAM|nr:hypothetical protein M407DRAFT_17199 [Tulasnella calospora MUT 4182]